MDPYPFPKDSAPSLDEDESARMRGKRNSIRQPPWYSAFLVTDGKRKYHALYGADHALPKMAYAWLRTSEIALGEIRSIDEEAARHAPGVLEILTYRNVGKAVGLPDLLYQ
jgi:CO/xanthine dehydrogenase Mo-binding subunit